MGLDAKRLTYLLLEEDQSKPKLEERLYAVLVYSPVRPVPSLSSVGDAGVKQVAQRNVSLCLLRCVCWSVLKNCLNYLFSSRVALLFSICKTRCYSRVLQ